MTSGREHSTWLLASYLVYKAFTDLFSSGCNSEQLKCGDGKCKHQYKTCKDDDSCGEDSDENNCCKYIFSAIFQKMVEVRSKSMPILMDKCSISIYFFIAQSTSFIIVKTKPAEYN